MTLITRSLLAIFAFGLFSVSAAGAAEFGGIREANIYPFIQYFNWEEFASDGSRILKESGPQYGVGGELKLDLLKGEAGAMTLKGKQELFGGVVDYDGQLQDGTPYKTDVVYIGTLSELDLGWAIPYRQAVFEPFAGISYRWWQRELQGNGGYKERWYSVASLFGVRSQYELTKESQFFLSGAAKYQFSNGNSVDFPGTGEVNLSPGSDWSVIADAGIRYKNLYSAVYYENFVFPKSDVVQNLFQPRSESEIFGLRIGWAFR